MYVDDADMEQSNAQNALPVGEGPSDPQTFSKDSKAYQIDCRTQAAVIQALIDLDSAGKETTFSEVDLYQQQAISVQQHKNFRKACNCAKSHCLKLYCECFARGQACNGCNCSNCMNNILFENERNKAIKLTLERNPFAFYPKIGSSERKHSKGCNCKRSNCLKNYCECYEAKISCSDLCRCQGCRNFDEFARQNMPPTVFGKSNGRKGALKQVLLDGRNKQPYNMSYPPSSDQPSLNTMQPLFNACITPEVIEVSCSCMLAQLYEAEEKNESSIAKEHAVLSEFARCLDHILESVDKLRNLQRSAAECGTLSEMAVHPLVPMVRPPQSLPIVPVEHPACDYIYADPGQDCATAIGDSFMPEPQLLEFSYKSDPAISDELIYNGNAFTVNEDVVAETPQICMQPGEFDEKCFGIVGPDGQVCSMPFCYDDMKVVNISGTASNGYAMLPGQSDEFRPLTVGINELTESLDPGQSVGAEDSVFHFPPYAMLSPSAQPQPPLPTSALAVTATGLEEFQATAAQDSLSPGPEDVEANLAAAALRAESDDTRTETYLNYDVASDFTNPFC